MCYSPVRHFTTVLLRPLVRLACVKRAASVRSEPGSNSHRKLLAFRFKGRHFNTPALAFAIQLSKNKSVMRTGDVNIAATRCQETASQKSLFFCPAGFLRAPTNRRAESRLRVWARLSAVLRGSNTLCDAGLAQTHFTSPLREHASRPSSRVDQPLPPLSQVSRAALSCPPTTDLPCSQPNYRTYLRESTGVRDNRADQSALRSVMNQVIS